MRLALANGMRLIDDVGLYAGGIPHDIYDELREKQPIYFNAGEHPFYAITRHSDAVAVLQNTADYSSAARGILIEDTSPEMVPVMRAMLPVLDPPEHTSLRQKLFPPLRPGQLIRFKSDLENACIDLVERAGRAREIEFVRTVAAEVPLIAFSLLMGLERSQIEPLRAPADAVIENGINASAAQVAQLSACLDAFVAERIRNPREDYMTLLAHADFDERPMNRMERTGMLLQIVIGGLETTRSAIAGMLAALCENPSQWELLRARPGVIANAVEESLRFVTPVNYLRRTTLADVNLDGVAMPAGTRVVVFLSAANRDPARFSRPHRLDIERSNARQHLTFGGGAHFCMGAALARLQIAAFWAAFAARISRFEPLAPWERRPMVQQNLIRSMPVRVEMGG